VRRRWDSRGAENENARQANVPSLKVFHVGAKRCQNLDTLGALQLNDVAITLDGVVIRLAGDV
jgi:hypothetical protein